jgi:hypothetical protein
VIMLLDNCPEPGCEMPAEVVDRFALPSTDGPVEHVALRCLDRHQFRMPVDGLPAAS